MSCAPLTPLPRRCMLSVMRVLSPYLRIAVVLLAALAFVIAPPIHASHDHSGDRGQADGPCVICKSLTTASTWTAPATLTPQLQPIGVLAADARAVALSAPASVLVPRAPPAVSFA